MNDRSYRNGFNDGIDRFEGRWKIPEKQRPTGDARLDWRWRRLRYGWMTQFPFCAHCGLLATQVHHIEPRSTAPQRTLDPTNLMSVCEICHMAIHKMGNNKENR